MSGSPFRNGIGAWLLRPRLTALLCGAFLISNALIACEQHMLFAVFFVFATCICVVLWRERRRAAAIAVLAVVVLVPICECFRNLGAESAFGTIAKSSLVDFKGRVELTKLKQGGKSLQFFVRTTQVLRPSNVRSGDLVLCRVPSQFCPQMQSGEQSRSGFSCSVRGYVAPARSSTFPWDYNESDYLRASGVESCVSVVKPSGFKPDSNISSTDLPGGEQLRRRILAAHRQALGERLGDLLSSVVIGERAVSLPTPLKEEFRAVGLSHILAASGFNITLAAILIWTLARYLTRSRLVLNLLFASSVALFVVVAGTSPSIERAAFMAVIAIIAGCHHKQPYAPASILLALSFSCLLGPRSFCDIGLQLSYVTTGGIIFFISFVSSAFERKLRIKRPFCHVLSGVLIAQSVVLPLQLFYFWQVGLLSVLANIIVAPLIAPIAILGFASSFLAGSNCAPLLILASLLDRVNWLPLEFVLWLVHLLASFRSLIISTGPPELWQVLTYYGAWLFLMFQIRALRKKASATIALPLSLLVFSTALILLFVRPPMRGTVLLCMPGASAVVRNDRNALIIGDTENLNIQKAVRYFGARVIFSRPFPSDTAVTMNNLEVRSNSVTSRTREHRLRFGKGSLVFLQRADSEDFEEVQGITDVFQ